MVKIMNKNKKEWEIELDNYLKDGYTIFRKEYDTIELHKNFNSWTKRVYVDIK